MFIRRNKIVPFRLCTLCFVLFVLFETSPIRISFSHIIMATCPRKFMIRDLLSKTLPFDVWLQGTIEQTVDNDILIISDSSGRAKITKCQSAVGIINKNSLIKGTYCCIIGVVSKTKGLPEVQATKFIDLTSQVPMKLAWDNEVKELNLFMEGKIIPSIE